MTQYSERELVLPTLALLDRMGLNHLPSGRHSPGPPSGDPAPRLTRR